LRHADILIPRSCDGYGEVEQTYAGALCACVIAVNTPE
jgi:hypothetical protein